MNTGFAFGGDDVFIDGIAWDVNIATVGYSWQSEAVVSITGVAGNTRRCFLDWFSDNGAPGEQ